MKCGTTSLYRYLSSHPQICACETKEPSYFAEIEGRSQPDYPYPSLWKFNPDLHRYALEASTSYTKFPRTGDVAKNIYEYHLSPKMIYIVRNPFERIVSHFHYTTDKCTKELTDPFFVDVSRYAFQLSNYTKYFPRENIKIIDFDDLKSDPGGVVHQLTIFLGLESPPPQNYIIHNPASPYPTYIKTFNKSACGKWVHHWVPARLKKVAKKLLIRAVPHPKKRSMTTQEYEQIHAMLREDMNQLKSDLAIDISKWGF